MASILFSGGPCDNERKTFDDTAAGTGTISCGGETYTLQALGAGFYTGHFVDPERTAQNPSGLPDGGVMAAWSGFYRALTRGQSEQLTRSKRARIHLREQGRK